MAPLRFEVFGAGFWTRCQLEGWREAGGAECAAIFNRTPARAEALARAFSIPAIYGDPEELFRQEELDFVDIITAADAHEQHVLMAAKARVPVICQKPMAPSLDAAERMVVACRNAGVPFFVHENWRWQTPIRALKCVLDTGSIGTLFRAWITLITGLPVFSNQPFLKDLDRFIISDLGSHLLDVARHLFGEATSLYCQTHRIHTDIRGEDVATMMIRTAAGTTVVVAMGYAETHLEHDSHPETRIFVEGTAGSVELGGDFWVRVTTEKGTKADRFPPPVYSWVDPAYSVVQASIVPCHSDILRALLGQGTAETTGDDNLKTVRLVSAAYQSALNGHAVPLG